MRKWTRTSELEDLGGEVLKDSGGVDGGCGANALGCGYPLLEEPVDTADRELAGCSAR